MPVKSAGVPAQAVRDFRPLPRRFDLARCLSLCYQRVVAADHTVTLGAHSIALPPLPGARGYAGETVQLCHHLEGTLHVYRGDRLLVARPLSLQEYSDRRPAPRTTAQKRKTPMPRIYNLSGRPALAAHYLNDNGCQSLVAVHTTFSGCNNTFTLHVVFWRTRPVIIGVPACCRPWKLPARRRRQ